MRDYPLGGTILSPHTGTPHPPTTEKWAQHELYFPNRLIAKELRSHVLEIFNSEKPSMNNVKELIERAILDKNLIKRVNSMSAFTSAMLKRPERLAIRKMMSRYWDNPSIFALELGGAVIRQSVFVDKMYSLDWLHSPAARDTMDRLLVKYSRFVDIMIAHPLMTVVPTLDVDLGWHTHQLSTKSYFDYTFVHCKKFIDHDDKLEEDALSSGFEWTSKTYEKMFQEVYSECTCWYCEGMLLVPLYSNLSLYLNYSSRLILIDHADDHSNPSQAQLICWQILRYRQARESYKQLLRQRCRQALSTRQLSTHLVPQRRPYHALRYSPTSLPHTPCKTRDRSRRCIQESL